VPFAEPTGPDATEVVLASFGAKVFFAAIPVQRVEQVMIPEAVPVEHVVDYFSPLTPGQHGVGRLSFAAMYEFTTQPCRAYLTQSLLFARVRDMVPQDQERCRALLQQAEAVMQEERARRAGIIRA